MNIPVYDCPVIPLSVHRQALPLLSSVQAGQQPADITHAFNASQRRFGETFDCSTHAAVIKMLMMTFGRTPADMFDKVKPDATGYAVTMKDEFNVRVTHDEVRRASQASRFQGKDPSAIRDANFVFAAFVKRKQIEGGYPNFESALAKTLEGETPLRCLKGMGVYGMTQYVPALQIMGKDAVAVATGANNFSGALVRDGVKYVYDDKRRVGQEYVYRLFNDNAHADTLVPPRNDAVVSEVPVGVKPQNIWSGFYQSVEGNCVTVSAIKAAMMRFGQNPAGIYRKISSTPDGYEVTFRDGVTVRLSHDELSKAKRASHFRGDDQALLNDANFLYAVSAKRAQLENNDFRASQSFEVAMDTLNDGEYPGQALYRLGLSAYVREADVRELSNGAIGTLADHGHSVAVINGAIDYYGQKYDLASSQWMNTGYRALKLV
ncbi:hypothetical protein [Pseudomonas costantinii]|uniref:Type III secretion effector protein n=1 Tax=Pseudomonas costantinii TaxID=168469 RepID=A0A1S2UQ58_9PSED|nr:hypothetical protein [Pseudomonas costantinii]NVZ21288.1 hypothetical protein [Pseudomonas costantinii]OIN48335.1 hypothetical protein BFL40_24370 [Pseudomonas costantinii]SED51917.1 hypothetical protein SAMN04515675_1416 [Pseudomonas costantinii]